MMATLKLLAKYNGLSLNWDVYGADLEVEFDYSEMILK